MDGDVGLEANGFIIFALAPIGEAPGPILKKPKNTVSRFLTPLVFGGHFESVPEKFF